MQAIILCGIQASGKSTFYQQHFFPTHVRISLDLLRTRFRENLFLDACLRTQQRFVVDNTNPTAAERAKYIGLAKAAGYEVMGYYFSSAPREAVERNSLRLGRMKIPEKGIYGTLKRLEPPSYAEGFDQLFYVQISGPGSFAVREWLPGPGELPTAERGE